MKRKLFLTALVLVVLFASAIPVFAVTGVNHPDFNRDKLREVVVTQTSGVAGLVAGVLPEETIKSMAKDAISGMFNFNDIGGLAGPALADLLKKTLSDYGIDIPDSVNIDDIVNGVLTNEYVNSLITSDFVSKVIDKTIDNLIDELVIDDVIDILTESVVDQLTDELWNNGNPSSSAFLGIQTGIWNTNNTGWNTGVIATSIALKLGISGMTGGIENYVDASKIDFTSLFSTSTILNAFKNAVVDTAKEYYDVYKPVLVAKVQARIDELKTAAKAELINELNKIFDLKISAREELQAVEAAIIAHIRDSKDSIAQNKDEILNSLKDLKKIVNKADKYSCLDLSRVNALLDKLIRCLEDEVVVPVFYTVTFDSAGGSPVASQQVEKGALVNKPADPVRGSDGFAGWYSDSATLFNFNETIINGNITLTAKWLTVIVDPILVSVDPFAVVEKLNGNKNNLKITIVGTYSDGSAKVIAEKTFSINNNAADTYEVGGYMVYVDTKGNVQIRACYIL